MRKKQVCWISGIVQRTDEEDTVSENLMVVI